MHSFDKFVKYDHTTNNITKNWNVWLIEIRKVQIITLVEYVREQMMKAISDKRQISLKWPTNFPAFINKKMKTILKVGRNYHVIPISNALYKVETDQESYIVHFDKHSYNCGLWHMSGLPCKHEMPYIALIRGTYEKYITLYFIKVRCYFGIIHPLPNKSK